jgi:transitional endoplasmic reticulum ATPase
VLTLTAVLQLRDRHGVVRLPQQAMTALDARDGTVLRVRGARTSGAVAVRDDSCPPGSIVCDELLLANLRRRDGDTVEVEVAPRTEAVRLVLTGPASVVRTLDPSVLRTALLGKVVTAGDQVSLPPSERAPREASARTRSHLSNRLGVGWTSEVLDVVDTVPAGPVLVTMGTVTGWQGGTTTSGEPTPEPAVASSPGRAGGPRTLADLPGLEAQGAALQEWLDLGFHHQDLLARLGASPGMGVLLTGPSGSGKAALVEAVATEVGARLLQLWGPRLAATEADAAAKQLTEVLARATREAPTVVLLSDVEAVAPREGAGPLLPVLLTAVRELVAAGRAAVVCTTAHPEQVTPQLRTPGTLDHELALPLPDRRQRLRLLEVATRGVPLADDVDLDAVAGRTPGSSPPTSWPSCARPACGPPPGSATATRRRSAPTTSRPRSRSCGPPRWRARRSTCRRSRSRTSATWPR